MHVIVVGAGVVGTSCAHSFLSRGHSVTFIESASTPNQGCSFGLSGFMGPQFVQMLCAPFKGKAGLASIFAKTRRLSWDVSLGQMKFLRALAAARSADTWAKNHEDLQALARYSVGLTEYTARIESISFEQIYGLLRVYTNPQAWEEAHADGALPFPFEWFTPDEAVHFDCSLENVPEPFLGAAYFPQELSGNGSYFSKQLQAKNVADPGLTMLYHTEVTSLIVKDGKAEGVVTDKGEITGDAVVLCNNLGVLPLTEKYFSLPAQVLTGWTLTAKTDPMKIPPMHTVFFENKDIQVTRLGNRLRVSGRFWLGDVTHELTDKMIEELYENVCRLLPMGAVWSECATWTGRVLTHADSLPSCGATPVRGLYLNVAHGVNGWSLAEGCAALLCDLVSGSEPKIAPEPYSPMRFLAKK